MHYFMSFLLLAIILTRKRELVALLLLPVGCLITVNGLWLFLTVPWVGLQCVIVVFPDHIHLLLDEKIIAHTLSSIINDVIF